MTEEYKGYTITIDQDRDLFDPREDDNLGTMVCLYGKYDLGDEQSPNFDNATSWYDERAYYFNNKFDIRTDSDGYVKDYLEENDFTQIRKWIDKNIVWLPLHLHDSSEVSINTTGWACNFDNRKIGFIWIHRDTILQEFGGKNLTELQKNRATDALVSEVESYDKYISDNTYAVNIHLGDELIDSCNGYDNYEFAETEAKRIVDLDIKNKPVSNNSPVSKCVYCKATVPKTELHFVCNECGIGMCDTCFEVGTEPEYHFQNPLENISPNMEQAIKEITAEGGIAKDPSYLCDDCVESLDSYVEKPSNKSYHDLSHKEIYQVANLYSEYIMDFDYDESGQPVSIYEFYDNEYQQLKEEDQHDY